MPVILLVLGVVTTLAGLILVTSGLAVRDGTFDTEVLTPGVIAVVGGLLLIGLGFVVRELRRIERALATQSMPRVARVESDTATLVPPPIPETEPQLMSAAATGAEVPVEDTALERLRAKRPPIPRVENGQLAEAADVSFALREVAGLEDGIAEVRSAAAVGRGTNGTAAPARIVPRIDARARQAASSGKAKVSVFNTFWPATPRREGQAAPNHAAAPAPPPTADESVPPPEPARSSPMAEAPATSAPISVLKSGVVEGMAYTLYSDGSIEAQLPQGTLRFGSISALRNHIDNTA
jgi:hypothetical protein